MAFGLDLGNLLVHLRADESQLIRSIDNAEKRLRMAADKMTAVGRTMTMRVTVPIVAMGTMATKSFASFDDAMAKSVAIMGDIAPQMRQEMERVAISLSKEGVNSARELAKALFYLASAGLTAEQSIRALPAVNEFAIAGMFDLSQAVEMAAGSQIALGLASKNPEKNLKNLTRVTDVLVGANVLAQATTQQFAEALANEAAAAMKVWGIELEEGVAMLAAYAAQNEKGAAAGSAFGRMLRFLMQGYRANTAEWKRLGLEIYDIGGNLRPLADIIEDLTNKLGTMSPKMKGVTLDLLGFQARSQQVIMPLLGMSDAIREYHTRLKEMSGYTKTVAEKNMESFATAMRITWNWVVSAALGIGRQLAPHVLKLGERVRTSIAFWDTLNDSVKRSVLLYAAVAAAIGPVLLATGLLLKSLTFMIAAVKTLIGLFIGLAAAMTSPLLAVLALTAIAYVLRAAWIQNLKAVKDVMQEFVDAARYYHEYLANSVIGKFVTWMYDTFKQAFTTIGKGWKEFIADVAGQWAGLQAIMNITWKDLKAGRTAEVWAEAYVGAYDKVLSKMVSFEKVTVETFKALPALTKLYGEATVVGLEELMEAVKTQFGKDADAVIALIKSKIQRLQEESPALVLPVEDVEEIERALTDLLAPMEEAVSNAEALADAYRDVRGQMGRMGKMTKDVYEAEMKALDDLRAQYEGLGMDVGVLTAWYEEQKFQLDAARGKFAAFRLEMRNWADEATNVWRNLGEIATDALDSVADALTEMCMRGKADFRSLAASVLADIASMMIKMGMARALGLTFPVTPLPVTPTPQASAMFARYQHGGVAWRPQIARIAEKEPELVTPFSELKNVFGQNGRVEVYIHNEGSEKLEISRAESYMVSDQRIIDVSMRAAEENGPYRRAHAQIRR